ncbi:hypothetical protein GCK32_020387, partial [Trichostrongylus colubriformis]
DGTVCMWLSSTEPICPLPSLPPPDSAASLVVLPAASAFTCLQPKKGETDELGAVPRWWFNGVSGSCQQFLFNPLSSDVSPNNFETLDHCESFCKDKTICSESGGRLKNPQRNTPYDAGMRFDQLTGEHANYAIGISTRYEEI